MPLAYSTIVWITTFILIWELVSQQAVQTQRPSQLVKEEEIINSTWNTHFANNILAAQKYVRQGKALILSPDDTCGVSTLKKDRASLQRLYDKGYADGKKISDFL